MLLLSLTSKVFIVHYLLKQKQKISNFSGVKIIWQRYKTNISTAKQVLFHHN